MIDPELQNIADEITNETRIGANTAQKIGALFSSLIEKILPVDDISQQPGTSTTKVMSQAAIRAFVYAIRDAILKGSGFNLDSIQFNPATETLLTNIGQLRWNAAQQTLEFKCNSDVVLSIGQENYIRGKNAETTQILNGKVVYVSGGQGANALIKRASNNNTTGERVIGVATQNIGPNNIGFVTTNGIVNEINTSAFAEGDVLWLGVDGALTNVKPGTDVNQICIGVVLRSHATQGSLLVSVKDDWRGQVAQLRSDLNETITALVVYDVSSHNDGAVFESLSTLLGSANLSTLIPTSVRRGGMSIRFIQGTVLNPDNKYVQYRLMHPLDNASTAAADFANIANWQGVDEVPTAGSKNLVKSGGVYNSTPTVSNSTTEADLAISDETGNVLAKFEGGHIQTKNFDSSAITFAETERTDLEVSDISNNIIFKLGGGHIKTKNFNSKQVVADIEDLKESTSLVDGREVVKLRSVFIYIQGNMQNGECYFKNDGYFYSKNNGIVTKDITLTNNYKENSQHIIFLNETDGKYYIYDNGTMYLYCNRVPRVSFILDDIFYDFSNETLNDWTASGFLKQIYDKFDGLLQTAPKSSDLNKNCRLSVSKKDLVEFLNENDNRIWAYPTYNDGNTSNLYIISNQQSFRAGYNLGFENQKHRILLLGGVHGNERLCQYNTYLFAKKLLTEYVNNQNLYNILLTCDIYIIPIVNVYGSILGTRWNGNGVNVERNFEEEWAFDESIEPFTNNYMGSAAASEFETQAIIKLTDIIKPDIVVDHHSYYHENQNLYCYTPSIVFSNAVFKTGCNLGRLLNKNYSQYYGSGVWYPTNGATTNVTNGLEGAAPLHFYEGKNILASGIMEVAEAISFNNGSYTGTDSGSRFSEDVLKISEYTLRSCIENLLEWVLNNSN